MNITEIEKYWRKFVQGRISDFDAFSKDVSDNRQFGVYKLVAGPCIMDAINNISGIMHNYIDSEEIVPTIFATTEALLSNMSSFKFSLAEYKIYLEANKGGGIMQNEILYLESLFKEIEQCVDYCIYMYDFDKRPIPYDKLRKNLFDGEIDTFIGNLKSLLANVSYQISRQKEGYHHSNVYLILRMLGFNVINELSTNLGRIDVSLELVDKIYIMEFKFEKKGDRSGDALQQILDNKYWERFVIDSKKIVCVGVGFSEEERNIVGHKTTSTLKKH